ncbi:hypothetical protein ACVMIH_001732 [Bradyrhizobium sp. USDA 4503]
MSKEPTTRADGLRAFREANWERNQALKRQLDARDAAAAAKDAPPAPVAKRSRPRKRRVTKRKHARP